jgi:hypothetical protein
MSGLGQEAIAQHLCEAVERLQRDIEQVELWAAVLSCFAQPVPDYQPDDRYRLGQNVKHNNAGD